MFKSSFKIGTESRKFGSIDKALKNPEFFDAKFIYLYRSTPDFDYAMKQAGNKSKVFSINDIIYLDKKDVEHVVFTFIKDIKDDMGFSAIHSKI